MDQYEALFSQDSQERCAHQFESLPAEIHCEIFAACDILGAVALSSTSAKFRLMFKRYFSSIVNEIIERDFSPAELLRNITAFYRTIQEMPGEFRSNYACHGGRLICIPGPGPSDSSAMRLSPNQMITLGVCYIVSGWEALFPSLRFASDHTSLRYLLPREAERVRIAIYSWWRFALLYHGQACSDAFWYRVPASPDPRTNFMRAFSTTRLVEFSDFWVTVKEAVATRLCPSINRVRVASNYTMSYTVASQLAWGTDIDNSRIVDTVMKLLPGDILHLLTWQNCYASKESLIAAIRFRHPTIESSTECLERALDLALWERQARVRKTISHGFPDTYGGVLDHVDGRYERMRRRFDKDAGWGILVRDATNPNHVFATATRGPGLLYPPS